MKGVTIFSGLGGVDCGMKWAGVEPVAAVEFDHKAIKFSQAMQGSHSINFPGSKFYLKQVQDVDWVEISKLKPDVLHASPVCSNFSAMKALKGQLGEEECESDIDMAIATIDALLALEPRYFSLEQVPGYLKSRSFALIRAALDRMNYRSWTGVINCQDYSVPQSRRRMIVLASRGREWKMPATSRVIGWKEAIAGIPLLSPLPLTIRQLKVALDADCLIQRVSFSQALLAKAQHQPCWSLLRHTFIDNRGGLRGQTANAVLNGIAYSVSDRAYARLASFPDWFVLPPRFAGVGIGYSVPPLLMRKIYQQLQ